MCLRWDKFKFRYTVLKCLWSRNVVADLWVEMAVEFALNDACGTELSACLLVINLNIWGVALPEWSTEIVFPASCGMCRWWCFAIALRIDCLVGEFSSDRMICLWGTWLDVVDSMSQCPMLRYLLTLLCCRCSLPVEHKLPIVEADVADNVVYVQNIQLLMW